MDRDLEVDMEVMEATDRDSEAVMEVDMEVMDRDLEEVMEEVMEVTEVMDQDLMMDMVPITCNQKDGLDHSKDF
jgi:hypothetical protein